MSGVIDADGTQWEHCCGCGKFVKIDVLGYEAPKRGHPYGRDLCIYCVVDGIENGSILIDAITPSQHWTPIYEEAA